MSKRICSLVIAGWEIAVARATHPEIGKRPILIESTGRVWSASTEAINEGIHTGMDLRVAQRLVPGAAVLPRDIRVATEEFAPFVKAIHEIVHELEVVAPGEIAFKSAPVVRAHEDEQGLMEYLFAVAPIVPVLSQPGSGGVRAGAAIADGRFTASIAARAAATRSDRYSTRESVGGIPTGSRVVPSGSEREFIAGFPIEILRGEIHAVELIDTFLILGIKTLGDLAAMPENAITSRFGRDGLLAHRLARGIDERPLLISRPERPLEAECELDPPVATLDQLTFAIKSLGDRLAAAMKEKIVAAGAIRLEAIDESGIVHTAMWRNESGIESAAERARWHIESWSLRAAICRIRLIPEGVVADRGEQLKLTGLDGAMAIEARGRAERAIARLVALDDVTEVFQVKESGGRLPLERAVLKRIDVEGFGGKDQFLEVSKLHLKRRRDVHSSPWPGTLPSPMPARTAPTSLNRFRVIKLTDRQGTTGSVRIYSVDCRRVVSAVGPFKYRLRWWRQSENVEQDLWQVILEDGTALLISCDTSGCWNVEAIYD